MKVRFRFPAILDLRGRIGKIAQILHPQSQVVEHKGWYTVFTPDFIAQISMTTLTVYAPDLKTLQKAVVRLKSVFNLEGIEVEKVEVDEE